MSKPSGLIEPSRTLPVPRPDRDGNLCGAVSLSPKACSTRAALPIPPSKVIPVIVVPGIMGTNLRATKDPQSQRNSFLKRGEAAWRPPNGSVAGLREAGVWKARAPAARQEILNPETLEVDPSGEIHCPPDLADLKHLRDAGWGEIHWDSYGQLLVALQQRLNVVFRNWTSREAYTQWDRLNQYDRARWHTTKSGPAAELTEAELKKVAAYHYPVYACGYNWLQSNQKSGERLRGRIESIRKYWNDAKQECVQVILVTHSMGGLVARACAKQIPDQIAGVIHGVMPALGAPVCYRRIACGTESSSPSNGMLGDVVMSVVADIVGRRPEDTIPVMATSPGALELLPNHLYPKPWLFASLRGGGKEHKIALVAPENSYEFYRDMDCWFRMIDPALADPAGKSKGRVIQKIRTAIDDAERFHKQILGAYYHPNTYAFYGADPAHLSFGSVCWHMATAEGVIPLSSVKEGRLLDRTSEAYRDVEFLGGSKARFEYSSQDAPGDGTVPRESGAGPEGKVIAAFRTTGYDHQGSYGDEAMLMLTQQLIARIVQGAK